MRSSQALLLATVLVAAVALLRTLRLALGVPLALVLVLAALALAFWPVRGRTLEEWLPVVAGFSRKALSGASREVVAIERGPGGRRAPGPLAAFELLEVESAALGRFGALLDRGEGRLSAVLEVGGEGFALLGDAERTARVARWSSLLAGQVRSGSLARLQWIERTLPDRGELYRARLAQAAPNDSPALLRARRSYASLLDAEVAATLVHELLLVVSVDGPRADRHDERAARAAATLAGVLRGLREACEEAGLSVQRVPSRAALAALVSRGVDPQGRARSSWPWPVAIEEQWSMFRTDGTWHATYWIAEWPRAAVGTDFLHPLLVGARLRRAVSLVMAPVAPHVAARAVEHARTASAADAALRRQHGFALTARRRREQEAVLRREVELADGHAAFRFSGYVTVSAADPAALEPSCEALERAAAACHLELQRLYGNQAEAFCCSLPVGRGCSP